MATKKGMKKTLRDRKGRFRKSHWSPLKKQLPAWVIIVVFMLMIPTVYALATVVIPAERISLFGQTTQPSEIQVTNSWVSFLGPNKAVVFVVLKNTAASTQNAYVNITLLDSTGNEIVNGSQQTGAMNAGASVTLTYYFHLKDIASEYSSDFIQVMEVG